MQGGINNIQRNNDENLSKPREKFNYPGIRKVKGQIQSSFSWEIELHVARLNINGGFSGLQERKKWTHKWFTIHMSVDFLAENLLSGRSGM